MTNEQEARVFRPTTATVAARNALWRALLPSVGARVFRELALDEYDEVIAQATRASERAAVETLTRNLLARIFRDGGQRTATYGTLEEACAQAEIEVAEYIAGYSDAYYKGRAVALAEVEALIKQVEVHHAAHERGLADFPLNKCSSFLCAALAALRTPEVKP